MRISVYQGERSYGNLNSISLMTPCQLYSQCYNVSWLVNSSLSPPAQIGLVSGSLNRKQSKIVNYRAPSYSLYVFTTVMNRCDRPLCICSSACRECQQHSVPSKLMIIITRKVFNTAKSLGRRFHFSIQRLQDRCSGDMEW